MNNSFKKGRSYEDEIAERYGERQPASGAMWQAKEDDRGKGLFKRILFQTKNASGQKSHTISREDLRTLERNASKTGRVGVYAIKFSENEEYFLMSSKNWDFYFKEPIEDGSG